ncbi:MAG TPA: hypothetical protein VIW64_16280 [Pyrinomonadaceae bacterium]|jgi:hypothetical protein
MNKTFLLLLAASQMQVAGNLLRTQDANDTGLDDVIGKLLGPGGNALAHYAQGDVKGTDDKLKLIADSIYDYLGKSHA